MCSAPGPSSRVTNLTAKLLALIDKVGIEIEESLPGPRRLQIVPSLPDPIKNDRVKSLRKEQRMLLRILYVRAVLEIVPFGETLNLVAWMKGRRTSDSVTRMAFACVIISKIELARPSSLIELNSTLPQDLDSYAISRELNSCERKIGGELSGVQVDVA
jgi:hypothetical protein